MRFVPNANRWNTKSGEISLMLTATPILSVSLGQSEESRWDSSTGKVLATMRMALMPVAAAILVKLVSFPI